MSYTIFTANPTALIAQPGRAVNTFPSGLVRVDQTYLGLTTEAATHRAILAVGNDMPDGDTSPCIDGLKIFPEVQERRREDGFTEYIVSAYGRTNTSGTNAEVFFNKTLSFGNLFYGGRQFQRTYLTASGPAEILTPPTFNPFFSLQNNEDVLGTFELIENDQVEFSRSGPNSTVLIGPRFIIGSGGGVVVRIKTTDFQTGEEDERHTLVSFNIDPKYISHDQRYFGSFSEFITLYAPKEDVARELANIYRLKVNGVEVS
jgi:hypothetical protein